MQNNTDQPDIFQWLRLKPISPESFNQLVKVTMALITVFVLIELTLYYYRRRKRLREAWDWFYRLCEAKDLSVGEMDILREMARCGKMQSPANLLKSIGAFDRAVDKTFQECRLPPAERDRLDMRIRELRVKLMFADVPPSGILSTTHGIGVGQRVRLEIFIAGQLLFYYTSVYKVAERDIKLILPALPGQESPFAAGQEVDVCFWRARDAGYKFSTKIEEISEGAPALLHLAHTDQLDREESRHFYRVDVLLPIYYHLLTHKEIESWKYNGIFSFDGEFKPAEGRVLSLSGGGLSFSCELLRLLERLVKELQSRPSRYHINRCDFDQ